MSEITKEALSNTIDALVDSFQQELFGKEQHELESYWFFKFNGSVSLVNNIYEFNKMLDLYGSHCRDWEEHHNGHICLVERVRDKYLLPKIRQFASDIETAIVN